MDSLLPDLFLAAGYGFLGALAAGLVFRMTTDGRRWSGLLRHGRQGQISHPRAIYLAGSVGLAGAFLITVLEAGAHPIAIAEAHKLFDGIELSALTGSGGALYLWSKVSGR